jgi:hypothetical protein
MKNHQQKKTSLINYDFFAQKVNKEEKKCAKCYIMQHFRVNKRKLKKKSHVFD